MSRVSPLAHIRQLCSLDINSRMLVPPVLSALKAWVPHSVGVFLWADTAGGVAAACASEPAMHRFAGRFAAEFAQRPWVGEDWPGFAELLKRKETCLVDFARRQRGPSRSPVHTELMQPNGLARLLACPVVARSGVAGMLVLLRSAYDHAFSGEDRRRLADVVPRLAVALDRRQGEHEFVDDGGPGGVLIVGGEGELQLACDQGRKLLHLATCPDHLYLGSLRHRQVDVLVGRLVAEATARPGDGPTQAIAVENEWGQFHFRASRLFGSDGVSNQLGIRVQRRVPAALKMTQKVDSFGLSPRLRELALLLGCSLQNDTIADRLGLRPSTVAGMVKDIYQQVGVNSRHALREILLRPS